MKKITTILAASALVLIGCDGDKGGDVSSPANDISFADVSVTGIKRSAEKSVSSGLDDKLTKDALVDFMESNDDFIDYELSGDNGDFVVTNIVSDEFSIGQMTFSGAVYIEDEDILYFDSVVMEDMASRDGDVDISIDKIYMNPPAYADAKKMLDSVDFDSFMTEDFDFEAQPFMTSGHGYIEGMEFGDDEAAMTLDFLGWSEDVDDRHFSFLAKGMTFEFFETDFETPVTFELGSLSVKNLHWDAVEAQFTGNPFHYNMLWPYMDGFRIKGLKFNADGFYLVSDNYGTWFTPIKDGKSYGYTTPDAMRIGFDSEPSSEEMQDVKGYFDRLGYDEIRVRNEGHVMYDYNNDLIEGVDQKAIIEDGMDITVDMRIAGSWETYENFKASMADIEDFQASIEESDPVLKEALKKALSPLDVQTYSVSLTDKSLMERIFRIVAEDQDVEVDDIKQQAAGAMTLLTLAAQTPYQSELALDYADSVGDFIEQGGTFKFGMSQDKSVDIIEELWSMAGEDEPDILEGIDLALQFLGMSFEHIPAGAETP